MYDFLLQLLFFATLTILVYLSARSLPRINEEENNKEWALAYLERWVEKLPLAQIDNFISRFFEKILRKARIIVLRLDNLINKYLSKKNDENIHQTKPNLFDRIKKDE